MTAVAGAVRTWLRIEGLAVLVASLVLYSRLDASWTRFAILFLAPDLSLAGYLVGPAVGAGVYNVFHTYLLPIMLGLLGIALDSSVLPELALIWTAHIGMDRAVGYGLKYPTGFHATHLGILGKSRPPG
jgi:uncharacterized protein DUF4260